MFYEQTLLTVTTRKVAWLELMMRRAVMLRVVMFVEILLIIMVITMLMAVSMMRARSVFVVTRAELVSEVTDGRVMLCKDPCLTCLTTPACLLFISC